MQTVQQTETSRAFLGVTQSVTGRRWITLTETDDRQAQMIMQRTDLPFMIAHHLARRGLRAENAVAFLDPKLRDLMPDPFNLKDMDKAVTRIVEAVSQNQKIAVFADYDVDGACSAALVMTWVRHFGVDPTLYVPDRIEEGFGPNETAMRKLAADHDLIICVDCGTLSHTPIAAAGDTDVIVLDHHLGGETLPPAFAVVNPNRQDESVECGYLCAAGVVFLCLVACNQTFRSKGQDVPDLLNALDLVALATVADVAPLVGLNRALVRQGLVIMARRERAGLSALTDIAQITTAPTAYHLGFLLGPRINAGGRVGKADLGARLLSTPDTEEARSIADKLNQLNEERRALEAKVQSEAIAQVEARGLDAPLVWAAGEGWHSGVVGIVAARLKEAANRPAIVIGLDGETGVGSGRSVDGIDLGHAVAVLVREGLILKGGGHKMAAGLTVKKQALEPAMKRLTNLLEKQGAHNQPKIRDLHVDAVVSAAALTPEVITHLETAGPFGAAAPAPRFALPEQRIAFAKRVGNTHLQLTLEGKDRTRVEAICFRAFDGPLGPALENHKGALFHCVGRFEIDDWGGRRKVKLRLEDAACVS